MCLAIPGRIESFVDDKKHFANVDISGVKRQVNIDLIGKEEALDLGDWVLVHVGFAMGKISEEHALEQLRMLAVLDEAKAAEEEARGYSFDFETNEKGSGK